MKLNTIEIVKQFGEIADCLETVASFAVGNQFEETRQEGLKYPLLFLELPGNISWSTDPVRKEFPIAIQVLTRATTEVGPTNQKVEEEFYDTIAATLTQTEIITQEVLSVYWTKYKKLFNRRPEFSSIAVGGAYEDNVYGWRTEFTIHNTDGIKTCELPLNPDGTNCLGEDA